MGSSPTAPGVVARRLLEEVVGHGRLDLIDELVAERAVWHQRLPISTGEVRGDLRAWITELRRAFPDLRVEIEEITVEGERAAARVRITGTHLGPLLGVPPTGRPICIEGVEILRVREGRIVEQWGIADVRALARQLGLPGGMRPAAAQADSAEAASPTTRNPSRA